MFIISDIKCFFKYDNNHKYNNFRPIINFNSYLFKFNDFLTPTQKYRVFYLKINHGDF